MNIILFILTAILSSIITIAIPHAVVLIRQYKTHKQQRERNLRAKIRKEVDWYLNELRND